MPHALAVGEAFVINLALSDKSGVRAAACFDRCLWGDGPRKRLHLKPQGPKEGRQQGELDKLGSQPYLSAERTETSDNL